MSSAAIGVEAPEIVWVLKDFPVGTQVRAPKQTDISLLVAADKALFGYQAWPASIWAEEINHVSREYLVVCAPTCLEERALQENMEENWDQHLWAYAGLSVNGSTAEIMTIATAGRGRAAGLGKATLQWLIRRAIAKRCDAILLEVRADNVPAIGLYASQGFISLHRRKNYYQPEGVDAIVMRLLLQSR